MTARHFTIEIPDQRIDGQPHTTVKLTVTDATVTAFEGPLPLDVREVGGVWLFDWHDGNEVRVYTSGGIVVALLVDKAADYWPPLHVERVDEVAA